MDRYLLGLLAAALIIVALIVGIAYCGPASEGTTRCIAIGSNPCVPVNEK